MPVADYRCPSCGRVIEHEATALPQTIEYEHDDCSTKLLSRVWAFRVGRGTSGNTPPR